MSQDEERLRACLEKMTPEVQDAFVTVLSYLVGRQVSFSASQIVSLVNSELEAKQNEESLAPLQR